MTSPCACAILVRQSSSTLSSSLAYRRSRARIHEAFLSAIDLLELDSHHLRRRAVLREQLDDSFTGIYGQSSSGGSGGLSTGPTEFSTSGFGLSVGAGSGGRATGPTNTTLPQFGGSLSTGIGGRPPASGGGILGVPNIMVPESPGR